MTLAAQGRVLAAARNAVLAVAEPARETLSVTGSEARSWLNGLVTADLAGVRAGQGAYALLLNKQGKVQTDLDVLATAGGLVLGVAAGRGEAIRDMLDRFLVMEDAELALGPAACWLRLFGPRAAPVAQELASSNGVLASGAVDWFGGGGAALLVARDALDGVIAESLARAGREAAVAAPGDWDALRVLNGFPAFGVDYGPDDNPHEASLERRAVSFSKGCYLGQEVVCMQDMRGKVKRRLVVLRFTGSDAAWDDRDVYAEGASEPVGRVSTFAHDGATRLALARLKAPYFEAASQLRVGQQQAEIVPPAR